MRFHYPLQKILDLKSNEKTQAEWMLSDAIGKLRDEENGLHELEAIKLVIEEALSNAAQNRATISDLQALQAYLEHVESQIAKKHNDVRTARTYVEQQQKHLTDKMLDEKVWVHAKEKAYLQYSAFMTLKEQNDLDELATMRYMSQTS